MLGRGLALCLGLSVLLTACGGSSSSPDATTSRSPDNAAGKTAGWDAGGKVTFEVTGVPNPFGDALGYSASRSFFGGDAQTFLSFANEGADDTLIIQVLEGAVTLQYAGSSITIPSAECQVPDLKLDATLSSGTFDCAAPTATSSSGTKLPSARIAGSFEARG